MQARRTVYKGITMRSRLEASFAAVLDSATLTWRYEPQCFADQAGQYLPDFLVIFEGERVYLEVKPPTADTSAALLKMHIIRASEPGANLKVVVPTGVYPYQGWTFAESCSPAQPCAHCAGIRFGWKKCSQEETDAFLADRPWP